MSTICATVKAIAIKLNRRWEVEDRAKSLLTKALRKHGKPHGFNPKEYEFPIAYFLPHSTEKSRRILEPEDHDERIILFHVPYDIYFSRELILSPSHVYLKQGREYVSKKLCGTLATIARREIAKVNEAYIA